MVSQYTMLFIWMCVHASVYLYYFMLACKIEENVCQNMFLMHIVAFSVSHFLPLSLYYVFLSSSDLSLGKSHLSALGFSTFEKLASPTLIL